MRPVVASGHVNHLFERKEDDDARSGDGDFAPLFHLLCCCFVFGWGGGEGRGGGVRDKYLYILTESGNLCLDSPESQ